MNILVISPIYPGPNIGENFTKVVHYFAKEWVAMGENVQVINIPSYFPRLLYHAPLWVRKIINKRFGSQLPTIRNSKVESFDVDNVPVLRVPLYKFLPGRTIGKRILETAEITIEKHLDSIEFKPDVIVAHWTEPSLYFVDALKRKFLCPTLVVTHVNQIDRYSEYIRSVDKWGYRRLSCVDDFKDRYPEISFSFRCKSGIPDVFLQNRQKRDFNSVTRFVYVGMMLPRKHPDKVIRAVRNLYGEKGDFSITLLGDGSMLEELRSEVKRDNLHTKIHLPGRVNRDEIINTLDNSDVFIMVSEDEVFGLVYIEAMARGCIIVASRGEGMDGIIEDGTNGFLVEAGNTSALEDVIRKIQLLSCEERQQISRNAIALAETLTDKAVASEYLDKIKTLVL